LILVILLTGGLVNQVRVSAVCDLLRWSVTPERSATHYPFLYHSQIHRWQLRAILRNLSRDWSLLPSTSSTAADLVNAYIGVNDPSELERGGMGAGGGGLRNPLADESQKPVMRWSMFTREGNVWTGWRPGEFHLTGYRHFHLLSVVSSRKDEKDRHHPYQRR